MNVKVRPLRNQFEIIHWIFGISVVLCPTIGLILIDKGYPILGSTALFFPVVQLALMVALAIEGLIYLERSSRGKKSFTPLSRLFFPEERYIEQLFKDGHEKEALEYAEAWLELDKLPDEERL